MSTTDEDYFAPTVSEYSLDPGGNYVSPGSSEGDSSDGVTLGGSIVD